MSYQVRAAPLEHHEWLTSRTKACPAADFTAIEAVDERTDRVVGMVGYECWTGNSVQAHMAVESPMAWRALLPWVFSYPFEQERKGVLLGVIPSNNHRSLTLARHLGFRSAHRILDGWADGVDLVIIEMRREECRYLRKRVA